MKLPKIDCRDIHSNDFYTTDCHQSGLSHAQYSLAGNSTAGIHLSGGKNLLNELALVGDYLELVHSAAPGYSAAALFFMEGENMDQSFGYPHRLG